MPDKLRAQIAAFLARHDVGLLSAAGPEGIWGMPARYRLLPGRDLTIACLLPAWADAAYFLEQDPRAALVIQDAEPLSQRWLQIQGQATMIAAPDWSLWPARGISTAPPEALYRVVRATPTRRSPCICR